MNPYIPIISIVLVITVILLVYIIRKVKKSQIQQVFAVNLILLFELCLFVFLQLLFSEKLNIPPIYFDYFAYIGGCFQPVATLFTGLVFANTKITFKKWYLLIFVIPIISLLVLWTNDLHNLFYVSYSIDISQSVFGPYFYIHAVYSYSCIAIGLLYLIFYSIKNSGFFSKQSLLLILGTAVPVTINVLATFGIIPMTVYITPISFATAVFFISLAIFKFDFLNISPIALQKIVDRMSDGYMVVNEEYRVIDFNETFLGMSKTKESDIRNVNLYDLLNKHPELKSDTDKFKKALEETKKTGKTVSFEKHFTISEKYFNIEISDIVSKGNFLGSLILFKDITQHILDLKTIENNQDLLIEKERLASLGQMIGGIAHNLKTPIMSIAGAAEGLTDLINEYDSSIDDPEVNSKDHHDIAKDMKEWVGKIKTHTSYMSDVITAVKGQAVALNDAEPITFTLEELIKRVDILMRHELKNALINLNISFKIEKTLELHGNINSLVQVMNNIISNSIQAYNGQTNKDINLTLSKEDNKVIISIQDFGMGMSKEVQNQLFKSMITTKGKNGTGLGLFMSYSNIRAHFNGNITFESEEGKGTTFYIIIPL